MPIHFQSRIWRRLRVQSGGTCRWKRPKQLEPYAAPQRSTEGRSLISRGLPASEPRSRSSWWRCPRFLARRPPQTGYGGVRRRSPCKPARSLPPCGARGDPSRRFARAAAIFTYPNPWTNSKNWSIAFPVMGKFSMARRMCTPQYTSSDIFTPPRMSFSVIGNVA
jgi:hypothetical protein